MALTRRLEHEVLTSKLEQIDARRAEIEEELSRYNPRSVHNYRRSELLSEVRNLGAERRVTAKKLSALDSPPDAKFDEKRKRFLDAKEAQSRQNLEHNIANFERQGDYRSARLYRQELLNLRRTLEERYS